MLPINFGHLAGHSPQLRSALRKLADWAKQHPTAKLINTRDLSSDLGDVDPWILLKILQLLVDNGLYKQSYAVLTPSGVQADRLFDDPRDIPSKLPDRFHHYFDTADADVVTVLVPIGH